MVFRDGALLFNPTLGYKRCTRFRGVNMKFKVVLVSSLSVLALLSFVGCGGSKVDSKPDKPSPPAAGTNVQPPPSDQPSVDTASGNTDKNAPPAKRSKPHTKKPPTDDNLKTSQEESPKAPETPQPVPAPVVQPAPVQKAPENVPPKNLNAIHSIACNGQGPEDFLKAEGYPRTMNEAMTCHASGEFSDNSPCHHSPCYIFFEDGHYEPVNGKNRDLIPAFVEKLEAEYKEQKAEKEKAPHKKVKIPVIGAIGKGLKALFK